jgi:hypothetical protein
LFLEWLFFDKPQLHTNMPQQWQERHHMSIFDRYQARYESSREEDMSLQAYLELCKVDPMAYASAAERLLAAIGEPDLTDTHDDPRLSRIFQNKVIKRYPAFSEFYGMEEAIEHLVSYLKHAAQGLEEKKQILYLLGPVGGGKSSLAEKLKDLMQNIPFYAIKGSPVFESPLSLFSPEEDGPDSGRGLRHPNSLLADHHVALGGQASAGVQRRHHQVPRRQALSVAFSSRSRSPRPSLVTKTTRTSRRWSAR